MVQVGAFIPKSIAEAKEQSFVVVDKKTQNLKALNSLYQRSCFWVKTKLSTKSQVAARNEAVQKAFRKCLSENASYKWEAGEIKTFLKGSLGGGKPLRARDLKFAALQFQQKDMLSPGKELKEAHNLESVFKDCPEAQAAVKILKEKDFSLYTINDLEKQLKKLSFIEQKIPLNQKVCEEALKDLKGATPESLDLDKVGVMHRLKMLCGGMRQQQNLKILEHYLHGTAPEKGASVLLTEGQKKIGSLTKQSEQLKEKIETQLKPAAHPDAEKKTLKAVKTLEKRIEEEESMEVADALCDKREKIETQLKPAAHPDAKKKTLKAVKALEKRIGKEGSMEVADALCNEKDKLLKGLSTAKDDLRSALHKQAALLEETQQERLKLESLEKNVQGWQEDINTLSSNLQQLRSIEVLIHDLGANLGEEEQHIKPALEDVESWLAFSMNRSSQALQDMISVLGD